MLRKLSLLLLSVALPAGWLFGGSSYDFRIARLSFIEGHVSFQHANDVDWSAASINMALQPADRIYTGEDGRAEIQFDDGSILRLAERTDVEILSLKEDFIQIRVLVGLTTLNVSSGVAFEINTPAAAFNTLRRGVYRFDVLESGDTDAIVRKGLLDAANNSFSQRLEEGELLHITGGDRGTYSVSRHGDRDEWDEWNDRRNADLVAYDSRKYLPDYVSVGVNELDRYGRWVVVDDYGPAWVPQYVHSGWSPYYDGRWYYRPSWGWTWISYEPWGWLPYHYGRWYHNISVGWCWIPGPTFGFRFWSPGLVRFYQGPGWVSWCPLGPGDYYNVNNYYFNTTYLYQLNHMRLTQRRGPEDLVNRNVPGAFRTSGIDQFTRGVPGRTVASVEGVDQPWTRGRVVAGQLAVQPTSESFKPLPNRSSRVAVPAADRPVVVRTEPAVGASIASRYTRITNPTVSPLPASRYSREGSEREENRDSFSRSSDPGSTRSPINGSAAGSRSEPGSSYGYWNRRQGTNPENRGPESRPLYRTPSNSGEAPTRSRTTGRGESVPLTERPRVGPAERGGLSGSAGRVTPGRTIPESRPSQIDSPRTNPRSRPQESSPGRPLAPSNRFERSFPARPVPPSTPPPRDEPRPRRSEPQLQGARYLHAPGAGRTSFPGHTGSQGVSRGQAMGSTGQGFARPRFSTGPSIRPESTIRSPGAPRSSPGGFSQSRSPSQPAIQNRAPSSAGSQRGGNPRRRPD